MSARKEKTRAVPCRRSWWVKFGVVALIFVAWTGPGIEQAAFAMAAGGLAATVSEVTTARTASVDTGQLARFIPYFWSLSFRGGIDVARRAFLPSMPLAPGFVDHRLRVEPDGPSALAFAAVISLIPGTLCVDVLEEKVVVHVIDRSAGFEAELRRLERRVGRIFGESIGGE